jgi:hypothetical protein
LTNRAELIIRRTERWQQGDDRSRAPPVPSPVGLIHLARHIHPVVARESLAAIPRLLRTEVCPLVTRREDTTRSFGPLHSRTRPVRNFVTR